MRLHHLISGEEEGGSDETLSRQYPLLDAIARDPYDGNLTGLEDDPGIPLGDGNLTGLEGVEDGD